MRATVTLDDELLELARAYTGIQATSALVQSALRQLVQKEAAKRLAGLGKSSPTLNAIRDGQGQSAMIPSDLSVFTCSHSLGHRRAPRYH